VKVRLGVTTRGEIVAVVVIVAVGIEVAVGAGAVFTRDASNNAPAIMETQTPAEIPARKKRSDS
jgi:hypothetical protein